MHAFRARSAFDGASFLTAGATVFVQDGSIAGVEPYGYPLPADCPVTELGGTLLPGLIDVHTHLVGDSGPGALDRVAGYSDAEIDDVITRALRDQLRAGVTTVRDLGDRRFCVVDRRDRQPAAGPEPAIVASGPPVTSPAGHCHYMGGEVTGTDEIIAAVAERAERGVDVIKVMASGGVTTPGTDVMLTQFSTADLRFLVDRAHAAGLGVTAHAHGTPAVEQAVAAGVDGIEHCSCMDETGFGRVSDETVAALAASGAAVCPTLGLDTELLKKPPLYLQKMLDMLGLTAEEMLQQRCEFAGRLHQAGVRLVSGLDSGIAPTKRHGALAYSVAELVAGGLTIAEALATATSGAAAACGVGGRKGRLAAGHDADLLAVDGDLEAGISALHRPESVVLGGVPVSR